MNVGELRHKIDICSRVEQTGPVVDLAPTYHIVIPNIWAKKIRLLSKEEIKLGVEHSIVRVNFIIRTRSNITEDMCIRYKDSIYNIIGYEELKEDKNYMHITTVRKQVVI